MPRMQWLLRIAALASMACDAAAAATPTVPSVPPSLAVTPLPRESALPTPSWIPGSAFFGGEVRSIEGKRLVVANVEETVVVELIPTTTLWRETVVAPSAIRLGDRLEVSGDRAANGLIARHIWANIGRTDGVVESVDGDQLVLRVTRLGVSSLVDAVLSRYLTTVPPATVASLRPGQAIGTVVYWRADEGPRRITRCWLDG